MIRSAHGLFFLRGVPCHPSRTAGSRARGPRTPARPADDASGTVGLAGWIERRGLRPHARNLQPLEDLAEDKRTSNPHRSLTLRPDGQSKLNALRSRLGKTSFGAATARERSPSRNPLRRRPTRRSHITQGGSHFPIGPARLTQHRHGEEWMKHAGVSGASHRHAGGCPAAGRRPRPRRAKDRTRR